MNTAEATILIVDDEANNREQLEFLLQPDGYRTITAASGKQALSLVSDSAPDLILLDVTMPDMDGFEVANVLKSDRATANIPIIIVTAHVGRGARMVGLDTGVEEYLTKPIDPAELSLRIRNLLRLKTHADLASVDEPLPEHFAPPSAPASDAHHLAHYDSVTGLPNATLFLETLRKTLADAGSTSTVAVMSIDLDDFKSVNDTLGTVIGDELLRQFGARLVQCIGSRDRISRMYGDKFALFLDTGIDPARATHIANDIREALRLPFDFKGKEVLTTASIGRAVYPKDGSDPVALAARADVARRQAKKAGGDSLVFYTG
jgi:diguanylate cyclase (GGDEF)-like protein